MDLFGGKRLICYEANEIPLRIFHWFAQKHPSSTIAKLMQRSTVIETVTDDKGSLSPWTTWPTMHRGVIDQQHCIYDFGQDLRDVNAEYPSIWELLSRGGIKVGMFGSLQSYPLPKNVTDYAFYVPDTFAAGPECFPEKLSAFQQFNLSMVDRSGRNVSSDLPLRDAARFLAAAPGLGLRGATIAKLTHQLASERVKPIRVVRRRTSQMQIAFDFFLKELKQTTPEAAFFFTNHVASSMHRYWPALFAADYPVDQWNDRWRSEFGDEIDFAMRVLNAQLTDLMDFVSRDSRYALVVGTSMGQAAADNPVVHSQLLFADIPKFMAAMGVPQDRWRQMRAMVPCYMVAVPDDLVEPFTTQMQMVRINGKPLAFAHRNEGVFRLDVGQENLDESSLQITHGNRSVEPAELGLAITAIQDEASAFAYHIPQGSLLIFDPAKPGYELPRQMSTLEYAPAMLRNFGLQPQPYMVS
jgi:hypothetical protein